MIAMASSSGGNAQITSTSFWMSEIGLAAEIARGGAEPDADHAGDHRHRDGDHERDAGPVEDAAERVATELIGAEKMLAAEPLRRLHQDAGEVLLVGIERRYQRRRQVP